MARNEHIDFPEADRVDGYPHPRSVYDLVGHEESEARLEKLFTGNRLHHTLLLSGPAGIGKATLAYRLVRRVLGGQQESKYLLDVPEADPVAQRIAALGHADFKLIRCPYDERAKRLRTEIPVAEARKVSGFFARKAAEGGWRVCLVDTIDEMNRNAANALLKTLEEPPQKAMIILLSNTPGRLPDTIRSRCLHIPLRAVPDEELESWLAAQIDAPEKTRKSACRLARGAPGRALAYLHNSETVLIPLLRLLESFPKSDLRLYHRISDLLSVQKSGLARALFWEALFEVLSAQAIYTATGERDGHFSPISLLRSPDDWILLRTELQSLRTAHDDLNMNTKAVFLDTFAALDAA